MAKQKSKLTLIGELLADLISEFGGSWRFITLALTGLVSWMIWNTIGGATFDPYPFILLNLVLSCLAALQAPIIMMSSGRQTKKDRELLEKDYNLGKAIVQELQLVSMRLEDLNKLIASRREHLNGKSIELVQKEDLDN